MSRALTRSQQLVLGLAVLAGLGLAAFAVFAVGSRQWLWADTFHVCVGFQQIHGVEAGTRVRVRGRDAGEVERVEVPASPSGEMKLLLRLDGSLRQYIRADASAQIVSEGMVGGKAVEIDPGTDAAPPVAENALIASRPSTDLGDVLAQIGNVFSVGNRQKLWKDSFLIRAGFRKAQGLENGTRVRVLGRDVGAVDKIELPSTPSGAVIVALRLDGRLRPLIRADASAQIVGEGMIGVKVIEIDPGSEAIQPVAENALIATRPTAELAEVLAQVGESLEELRKGKGSLGKLLKDDAAYEELVGLIRQSRGTMTSLKQDANAIKGLPILRNYVQDMQKELVRPDCERNRRWFGESDLFEPGRAVLTDEGRKRLDNLVPWIAGLKHQGSEVVVAAYAAPTGDADLARTVTQKQSEAVCDYLTNHHAVQKIGWLARRKVTPLGCGVEPPPVPVKEDLPGLEVLVFVPQG